MPNGTSVIYDNFLVGKSQYKIGRKKRIQKDLTTMNNNMYYVKD